MNLRRLIYLAAVPAMMLLLAHTSRAQDTKLYAGNASVYVPYYKGGDVDSPKLRLGFDNNGATPVAFTMDTGSVGIIASPDHFQPTSANRLLGPGRQVYSSSGRIEIGNWYSATQQIYGSDGVVVATAEVPVLLVTEVQCTARARNCHERTAPRGIAMMGVGFGRNLSNPDRKTPDYNPLLNLTAVRLAPGPGLVPLPADWTNGYVVTSEGVHLGLSSANTANASFVKLKPADTAATGAQVEWRPPEMHIEVNGVAGDGTVLMDTGVGVGYLTAPAGSIPQPYAACANDQPHCAPPDTQIKVSLPGATDAVISFSYRLDSDNPMRPSEVVVVRQDDGKVFYNTSRRVLQGLDYIYDAKNGFVGYRWKDVPGTDGFVNAARGPQ
jgi:hypothetical protein